MSCDVGGHIGFSFTWEHRQNGERQGKARGLDRTRRRYVDGSVRGPVQDGVKSLFQLGSQIRRFT